MRIAHPTPAGGNVTIRLTSRWPYNPISLAVGLASGSREFSHAIAIIGDRAWESSMPQGCRAGTSDDLMAGVAVYRDMQVWVPDLAAAIEFADAQVGSRYDWAGALGIPLTYSQDWNDESRWWCSELVFAIVMAGGTLLFDPAMMGRVRPIDLHMLNYPKTAIAYLRPVLSK